VPCVTQRDQDHSGLSAIGCFGYRCTVVPGDAASLGRLKGGPFFIRVRRPRRIAANIAKLLELLRKQ